jgi:hypothetical protein
MGSLRVIELQLVTFILVFSASDLVSLVDLVSPLFVSLYLLALSRWVFPNYRKQDVSILYGRGHNGGPVPSSLLRS